MANMGTALKTTPLEEYLSNPAYQHAEWVDGEVVELNVGTKTHARIQARIARKLDEYLERHGSGYVAVELHCRLRVGGGVRFRLPDVAVVLGDEQPTARYLERAPDLAVEIRSPEDSLSGLHLKIAEYLENGARLAWLILPEEQAALVFTPNAPTRTVLRDGELEGGDVLPGLRIPLSELLA